MKVSRVVEIPASGSCQRSRNSSEEASDGSTAKHSKIKTGNERAAAIAVSHKDPHQQTFSEMMGVEMVDLFAGKKRQLSEYTRIKCARPCLISAKMFNGGLKQSRENAAEFPEYNPESFEVLLNWVYTGKLSQLVAPEIEEEISTKAPACSWCPFEMYALADKLRLTQLMVD